MNQSDSNHPEAARRIVVGIDGSRHAVEAALWAAALADRRGATLQLLHAFRLAGPSSLLGRVHTEEYVQRRTEHGEALLDEVREEVLGRYPHLWITGEVAECDPARLLVSLSHDASLVSVGTRGRGGFADLLLGSVSLRLAAHCHCPAVFVPGQAAPRAAGGGPVVLGVEEDEPESVLEFAFRIADDLGTGVRLVHAWEPIALRTGCYLVDPAFVEAEAQNLLDVTLKSVPTQRYPDVTVTTAAVRGSAAGALIETARGAPLVVVGAHRARSALSVGVGAVVHGLLSHATCPVAVVPAAVLCPAPA